MIPRQPGNVADVLRLSADRVGDSEALAFEQQRWDYVALNERVNRLAGGLRRRGMGAGDVVGSIAWNSDSLLVLYFALAKLGAVNVPLNTMLTSDDVRDLVQWSGAELIVHDDACRDRVEAIPKGVERVFAGADGAGTATLGDLEADGSPAEPPLVEGGDRLAMVIYTSGSTGRPKGCMKNHANLLWSAVNCQLETPRRSGGVELYAIPLAGVGFANFVMPALMSGARIVLDRFEPARCLDLVQRERATHMFLAGSMLDAMLRVQGHERRDLSSLELVETAYQLSDRLRTAIAERFGPIVRYCYGSTEGTNWAAPADAFMTRPDCVGWPKGLDEFRIADDAGRPVAPGEVGEVLVGGPTVMLGYFGDPETTATVVRDGWLLTGDLGELDRNGMMLFRGRKKDMIKTGGMNVAAGEVELALARHAGLVEVAVIGIADDRWGEAVTAVVVPADAGASPETIIGELRSHCREHLAAFKRPKHYVVVDALPKNPTGKVAKGVLRDRYVSTADLADFAAEAG